jgi:hypothetical protein
MDRSLDRDTWQFVLDSVRRAARLIKKGPPGARRPLYPNWLIVAMYLWAVWHDRCLSWACVRAPALQRADLPPTPRKLPSISQFTRRIKTDACQQILQHVHNDLATRARHRRAVAAELHGRQAGIGQRAVSKDPDAARGHISSGGYGKGYKMHAYITQRRRILVWCLSPLNTDEKTVARELLLPTLPPAIDSRCQLTLVDSNYDAAPLYKAFANARDDHGCSCGHALLAPVRGRQFIADPGGQRHPGTICNMGPQRYEAVRMWERHPDLVRFVMKQRNNAEGVFSVLAVALGLSATLPSFVRRIHRVRPWIGGKIILYHARLLAQEHAEEMLAA